MASSSLNPSELLLSCMEAAKRGELDGTLEKKKLNAFFSK
jgi:hypothetical protein